MFVSLECSYGVCLPIASSGKISFLGWVRITGLVLLFCPQWKGPQVMLGISKGDKGWIIPEDEEVWESLHCGASSDVELL